MNKTKNIVVIIISLVISGILVILSPTSRIFSEAKEVYRVYLDGKSIGLIESKAKLENYINEEQQELKKQYDISTVYIPNGVDIVKEITYSNNLISEIDIYEKIKKEHPFTIKGYKITIETKAKTGSITEEEESAKTEYIYLLDKNLFDEAVKSTITAFVNSEQYEKYLVGSQEEIKDVGTLIETVYFDNQIKISEERLNTDKKIFTSIDELKAYLLFGTEVMDNVYTTKKGDTISSIAEENKLSSNELLIVNPDLNSENTLLYEGQKLNVGIIDPVVSVIEETHVVDMQDIKFSTVVQYNYDLMAGTVNTLQEGQNGVTKVTTKVKKENGEIIEAKIVETEEIIPVVNKVVERGGKFGYLVGEVGYWYWPTKKPYRISSYRGWRWGRMHEGVDITGTGHGSPIYAANDGIVTIAVNNSNVGYGNWININHQNGYHTRYAHLSKLYVKVGDEVKAGQLIGAMGNTGNSTGTHLHFEVRYNGKSINPFLLY